MIFAVQIATVDILDYIHTTIYNTHQSDNSYYLAGVIGK